MRLPKTSFALTHAALLLLLGAHAVEAQEIGSNQGVGSGHEENPRARVMLAGSGPPIEGTLVELGSDAVRLIVNGKAREVRLTDVERIEVRERDSLKNGALIGAVALGAWCAWVCGQGLDGASQLVPAVAANAGLGALVGAGIDARRQDRTTIYPRLPVSPADGAGYRITFAYGLRF